MDCTTERKAAQTRADLIESMEGFNVTFKGENKAETRGPLAYEVRTAVVDALLASAN